MYDATGAGDVDISTEIELTESRSIIGLTGRKLQIPKKWVNPSGSFFCGMKPLFDLCSSTLKSRLKKERKEKFWQPFNDEALAKIQFSVNDLDKKKETDSEKNSEKQPLSISVLSSKKNNQSEVRFTIFYLI